MSSINTAIRRLYIDFLDFCALRDSITLNGDSGNVTSSKGDDNSGYDVHLASYDLSILTQTSTPEVSKAPRYRPPPHRLKSRSRLIFKLCRCVSGHLNKQEQYTLTIC
jgi:hypothetical protein